MRRNLQRSIKEVLRHEGGFVNHPADPGGATNYGVTLRTYQKYKRNFHLTAEDLRRITQEEVYDIYKTGYWDTVRADDLPDGVDFLVFDMAINAGPGRASKLLQEVIGVNVDGRIGPMTLRAANQASPDITIRAYTNARAEYYQSLPHFPTFGRGWLRRTHESEQIALSMLG
jgi:lysozyme family protein